MSAAVKISDAEMAAIKETSKLQNRSIVGQAEYCTFERDPRFGYAKVEQALKGLLDVDDLNNQEQEEFFDRVGSVLAVPSALEDAFFKDRQERGLGVGMDEAGNIIEQQPTKGN